MAEAKSYFDMVPALNEAPEVQHLEASSKLYNLLPSDSQQPELSEQHVRNLAALFVRNHAERALGIHLAHGHFAAPDETVMLGINFEHPYCRWARPTAIQTINLKDIHGHIFILTKHGFHPYEYQAGPTPDLGGIGGNFISELTEYLVVNNLQHIVGLQVLDPSPKSMLELVLPQGTIMLDASVLKGCKATRRTGWRFSEHGGTSRVCKNNESHGQTATHHEIYNQGSPCPELETFEALKVALAEKGILSV